MLGHREDPRCLPEVERFQMTGQKAALSCVPCLCFDGHLGPVLPRVMMMTTTLKVCATAAAAAVQSHPGYHKSQMIQDRDPPLPSCFHVHVQIHLLHVWLLHPMETAPPGLPSPAILLFSPPLPHAPLPVSDGALQAAESAHRLRFPFHLPFHLVVVYFGPALDLVRDLVLVLVLVDPETPRRDSSGHPPPWNLPRQSPLGSEAELRAGASCSHLPSSSLHGAVWALKLLRHRPLHPLRALDFPLYAA